MAEKAHTPTPWKIGAAGDICHGAGGWNGVPLHTGWVEDAWINDETAKANAAFIVRAVNSHDKLVEALRLVAHSGKFQCFDDDAWDVVNAALASLDQEPGQ